MISSFFAKKLYSLGPKMDHSGDPPKSYIFAGGDPMGQVYITRSTKPEESGSRACQTGQRGAKLIQICHKIQPQDMKNAEKSPRGTITSFSR